MMVGVGVGVEKLSQTAKTEICVHPPIVFNELLVKTEFTFSSNLDLIKFIFIK